MFIQSFRCHVFSVSFSFESRKTLYSVRCLYQFALFAYFLSYLTYGKQIKRTSFRLLVGVCVYKLLVANHRHPLTLKCTSMCSAFSSHPEIMNRILARLSDFSVACAYIIDGIPAHSFFLSAWMSTWCSGKSLNEKLRSVPPVTQIVGKIPGFPWINDFSMEYFKQISKNTRLNISYYYESLFFCFSYDPF